MQGSGILGTTAGEEVGLSGLPDRNSVVQLMQFGESPSLRCWPAHHIPCLPCLQQ